MGEKKMRRRQPQGKTGLRQSSCPQLPGSAKHDSRFHQPPAIPHRMIPEVRIQVLAQILPVILKGRKPLRCLVFPATEGTEHGPRLTLGLVRRSVRGSLSHLVQGYNGRRAKRGIPYPFARVGNGVGYTHMGSDRVSRLGMRQRRPIISKQGCNSCNGGGRWSLSLKRLRESPWRRGRGWFGDLSIV